MARVKRGTLNNRKHKKFLKLAKGIYGRANRCYKIGRRMGERAQQFQYVGRKNRKRDFRSQWISIINTFCRQFGINYSRFINAFNQSEYRNHFDRKTMSIAIQHETENFTQVFHKIVGTLTAQETKI